MEKLRENVREIFRKVMEGEPTSDDIEAVVHLGRLMGCSANDPSLPSFVMSYSVIKSLNRQEAMQRDMVPQLGDKVAQSAVDKIVKANAVSKTWKSFVIWMLVCFIFLFAGHYKGYLSGAKISDIPEIQLAGASIAADALLDAVRNNDNPWFLKTLISAGANPNIVDKDGNTPLLLAVKENASFDVITAIIKGGANVNAMDKSGGTPLWYSTTNFEIFSALIAGGADVNMQHGQIGYTPLMAVARTTESHEFIIVLIKAGADVTMTNRNGKTALDYAKDNPALKDKPEILKLLGGDKKLTEKDIKKK